MIGFLPLALGLFSAASREPDIGQPRVFVRIDADANEHSLVLSAKGYRLRGEALIVRRSR